MKRNVETAGRRSGVVGRNIRKCNVYVCHDCRSKKGWLDAKEYGEVARKGWIALCSYIDKAGDVKAVCEGTMIKNSREHYINRLALTGDLHGQAPVLWCAYALVTDFKTNK